MAKAKTPKSKNVIWVSDKGLAVALQCNEHQIFKISSDEIIEEWFFYDTTEVRKDIDRYEARELQVNAHKYASWLGIGQDAIPF